MRWPIASIVMGILSTMAVAADWTTWRGPGGQGVSDDPRVPLTWGPTTNLLWKVPLPARGNSTPIVQGDRIFLTAATADGKERHVLCLATADGAVRWKRTVREPRPGVAHEWNGYASASCAVDGERVYAFLGESGLFCFDWDGNPVWNKSFGVFTYEKTLPFGPAATPFLFEDLVIQNCDNDGSLGVLPAGWKPEEVAPQDLVALDKKTGAIRWRAARNQGKGSSTPRLVATATGRQDLLLNGPTGLWAYDPKTGKEIWHCDRKGDSAKFGEMIPLLAGDTLFVTSGRPNGPMQAVRMGGTGDVTPTHRLWEVSRKTARDISSHVLWEGLIYAADWQGFLSCYDTQDGKMVYKEKQRLGPGVVASTASPIVARGKVLFVMENGETVVLEPGREYKVLHRNRLSDGTEFRASPAIADGRLYLRSQSHLYCIGEGK